MSVFSRRGATVLKVRLVFLLYCGSWLCSSDGPTQKAVECEAAEIQASDICAGYEYNLSLLPRMRVIYEYVLEHGDAFYKLTPQATRRSPNPVLEDYWTDRTRFFLRMPNAFSKGQLYVPPDNVVNPDVLLSKYMDMSIFSYGSVSADGFRLWSGAERDGQGGGVVGAGSITERLGLFLFPPLGVTDETWGPEGIRHPIDVFFARGPEALTVLGTARIGAVETVVVQQTVREKAPDVQQQQVRGKLEIARLATAWIDMRRGCLPLRMDRTSFFLLDGNRLGPTNDGDSLDPAGHPEASFIVVVSRIECSDGGAYYPCDGYTVQRCVSPDYKGPFNDMQGVVQGKTVDVPMVDLHRMTWRTHSVQRDVAVPNETLALAFPPGTRYFDLSRNRGMIEGLPEEALDRLLKEERGAPRAPRTGGYGLKSLLVVVNLVVIGALVYTFWLRRKKR